MMAARTWASCTVCLQCKALTPQGDLPIHWADVEGETTAVCPGSSEPPIIADDLRHGDLLVLDGRVVVIDEPVTFENDGGRVVEIVVDEVPILLPADEPVVVRGAREWRVAA